MSVLRHVVGLLAVAVIRSWNTVVTRTLGQRGGQPPSDPPGDPPHQATTARSDADADTRDLPAED